MADCSAPPGGGVRDSEAPVQGACDTSCARPRPQPTTDAAPRLHHKTPPVRPLTRQDKWKEQQKLKKQLEQQNRDFSECVEALQRSNAELLTKYEEKSRCAAAGPPLLRGLLDCASAWPRLVRGSG